MFFSKISDVFKRDITKGLVVNEAPFDEQRDNFRKETRRNKMEA